MLFKNHNIKLLIKFFPEKVWGSCIKTHCEKNIYGIKILMKVWFFQKLSSQNIHWPYTYLSYIRTIKITLCYFSFSKILFYTKSTLFVPPICILLHVPTKYKFPRQKDKKKILQEKANFTSVWTPVPWIFVLVYFVHFYGI